MVDVDGLEDGDQFPGNPELRQTRKLVDALEYPSPGPIRIRREAPGTDLLAALA